ncbi:4-hydroxythreonine-4-phosphate dehydrogenase PdxA [Aquidulcibacter sp.]|uniref:4-hydroxythreonine-4-phosphate dehydrogenase PdxA n=1 Tax=Aquidulcibacter sp. TaxID=2052990 RepID=UPI0034F70190
MKRRLSSLDRVTLDLSAPKRPLVISMGDPAGIGPEVTAKAWQALRQGPTPFCVLGDPALYSSVQTQVIKDVSEAVEIFDEALPIFQGFEAPGVVPGQPNPTYAGVILSAIERGVDLVLSGQALALVTAPIAKSVVMAAGFSHPGHTEFLGALLSTTPFDQTRGPVMMLAVDGLRVIPVTIHCALAEVPSRLTQEAIIHAAIVTAEALKRDLGLTAPRLVIAALNPHAGEDGAFGDEEGRIIAPAVAALKAKGLKVRGPLPADSLFHTEARATFDAAICMYHDQALIPLKALDFWGGTNATLGLPIIRTSPDHGTGFDIAGRGIARPESMIAAIQMAAAMAHGRMNQ